MLEPKIPDNSNSSRFAATRWSIVIAAGNTTGAERDKALQELAKTYWLPLYSYIRRKGHNIAEAEDLAQGFFAHLLEKHTLAKADKNKGRFRAFLLTSLKNYIADQWDAANRLKRGGNRKIIPIDSLEAECFYSLSPVDNMTPEKLFDRNWAMTLLAQVMSQLTQTYAQKNQSPLYDALKGAIDGSANPLSYAQIGQNLNMTEAAVKTAAYRLKKQFRQALRDEIAHTVSSETEIDDEIRFLMDSL